MVIAAPRAIVVTIAVSLTIVPAVSARTTRHALHPLVTTMSLTGTRPPSTAAVKHAMPAVQTLPVLCPAIASVVSALQTTPALPSHVKMGCRTATRPVSTVVAIHATPAVGDLDSNRLTLVVLHLLFGAYGGIASLRCMSS